MYQVKEIFKTLQGEGFHTGRAAVFCRFSGCNLWSGLESARASAVCKFCDTDFRGVDGVNGGAYTAAELVSKVLEIWGEAPAGRFVVLTGGEPMLQVDQVLVDEFHKAGFFIAIETNGTKPVLESIDHVCVSPKDMRLLKQRKGHELKVIYPDVIDPAVLEDFEFDHLYLQPKDDANAELNTQLAVKYCIDHPRWKLSLQTHKYLSIP